MRESSLRGKRVFVTGHTGFTGSWAILWLSQAGAIVHGYSLAPDKQPNLYDLAGGEDFASTTIGDIRDLSLLGESMEAFQPDLVLHLAAQPLVRRSYSAPLETFEINVQGTGNVIASAMKTKSVSGVLCITTDKVYKNHGKRESFKEIDELGGHDPYSASKAAAEILIASFRDSFPEGPTIAVARGGNIIGGGDWSEDRIMPDAMRAWKDGIALEIRNPKATRPWQHVLALVEGYVKILEGLVSQNSEYFGRAFNLGPIDEVEISVSDVMKLVQESGAEVEIKLGRSALHEAEFLGLDSSLAQDVLGWAPRWDIEHVVSKTVEWYRKYYDGESARALCLGQLDEWLNSGADVLGRDLS